MADYYLIFAVALVVLLVVVVVKVTVDYVSK